MWILVKIMFFFWKSARAGNNSFILQYVFYGTLPQCTHNDTCLARRVIDNDVRVFPREGPRQENP